VAPLRPPENCALIVTARRRFAFTGVARIDLDLLAPDEAAGLLRSIVGEGRATKTELSKIATLCGFLPAPSAALRSANAPMSPTPMSHISNGSRACFGSLFFPGNREISKKNREAIEPERAITERD
jgi:hypothetical protein